MSCDVTGTARLAWIALVRFQGLMFRMLSPLFASAAPESIHDNRSTDLVEVRISANASNSISPLPHSQTDFLREIKDLMLAISANALASRMSPASNQRPIHEGVDGIMEFFGILSIQFQTLNRFLNQKHT